MKGQSNNKLLQSRHYLEHSKRIPHCKELILKEWKLSGYQEQFKAFWVCSLEIPWSYFLQNLHLSTVQLQWVLAHCFFTGQVLRLLVGYKTILRKSKETSFFEAKSLEFLYRFVPFTKHFKLSLGLLKVHEHVVHADRCSFVIKFHQSKRNYLIHLQFFLKVASDYFPF